MPVSAISSVRGMGLAVSVSTSTPSADALHRLLVRHPEALLLVDDQQAELLELHVLGQQPVRADDDVDAAVRQALHHLALLGRGEEAAQELDPDRIRREALGEGLGVLARQERRRDQDGRLRPVLHRLEDGPDRHLGLAEADVAADQAVHRPRLLHVGLDVGDGLELVLGLDEAERRLHLGLPRGVRAEGVALDGQAAPVELDQLGGHLAGGRPRLAPACAASRRRPSSTASATRRPSTAVIASICSTGR